MSSLNSLERAVTFVKNYMDRRITVACKADGSVPAHLNPGESWMANEAAIAKYLMDEVRVANFQDVMKRKGYGSIFLVGGQYCESVLHIRVMPGPIVFHYLD